MTRLAIPGLNPPRPHAVVLGELAIAAGIAGRPVSLCYEGFSGPELCEIWRYFSQRFDAEQVAQVYTVSDARRLGTRIGDVRLALVHAARPHGITAWTCQMASMAAGVIESRPTVFTRGVPDNLDEAPGATLVLRSDDEQASLIAQWSIMLGNVGPDWGDIQPPESVHVHPELATITVFAHSLHASGPRRIQERQAIQGLMVGAGLLRTAREGTTTGAAVNVTLDDYTLVRRLLQSRLVATPDVSVDRLAVDMVNRANVYLGVKYGLDQTAENPFPADEYYDLDRTITERRGRPLVTRREIADLGNTRSGMVRRLIEHLQRRSDGYELFGRMGLAHRPPERHDWTVFPASRLAGLLRPWTEKQTRTHFERLHKSGLITAERQPTNGPWRYLLPEVFSTTGTAFRDLPPAEQLAPAYPPPAAG